MANEMKGTWTVFAGHHHAGESSFLKDRQVTVSDHSTNDFTFGLKIGPNTTDEISFNATQKMTAGNVAGFTFTFEYPAGDPSTRKIYSGAAKVSSMTIGGTTYKILCGSVIRGVHTSSSCHVPAGGDEDMGTFMAVKTG